jgi:protein O-GlcNAc transferase
VSLDKRPLANEMCDVIIEKPTFVMKIDSTYNMYHHFCDFVNLYASQHLNFTHPSSFSTDNHILIWETHDYWSPFAQVFSAFSENHIWTLNYFKGQRACFKNIVFPLLPRMIFGLYYNTPLINGCENSALFHAFSEHVLHRLHVEREPPVNKKVRITFLSRNTRYRNVLNEKELIKRISKNSDYDVRAVVFDKNIKFVDQLQITRNTDVLIGMHGAGLTHLLFLPKWATLFELYNCGDPNCYKDLARLRGVNYLTWEDNAFLASFEAGYSEEGHEKFKNYRFDADEFGRLVAKAVRAVKNNPDYKQYTTAVSIKRDEL